MARKKSPVARTMTKKQRSRKEREDRVRFWLFLCGTLVIVLIVGVLGYGAYQEYIVKPASPVATVNDTIIRIDDYQRRVLFRRFDLGNLLARLDAQLRQFDQTNESQAFLVDYLQQQRQQVQENLLNAPTLALDEMIEEELVAQEAGARGLTVTEDELQLEIERQFGYDRNPPVPTPTPITATVPVTVTPVPTTPPMTEDQFNERYGQYVDLVTEDTGFGESDFRQLVQANLLRQKLQDSLAEEVETSGEQVHARHILLGPDDEELAKELVERLRAGEDFEELAREYSTDDTNREEGGHLGWFARGRMVAPFEEAAFALQPGEISDVVETTFGYHIIQVTERDDNRPFDEATVSQKQSTVLREWLDEQLMSSAVKRYWSSDLVPKDKSR
jgi:parvulin-like peptidyl-prolyl isomerase